MVVQAMSAPPDKAFFKKLAESIRAERRLREAEREAAAAEVRVLHQRLARLDMWERVLEEARLKMWAQSRRKQSGV